jgi:hypothetical protein
VSGFVAGPSGPAAARQGGQSIAVFRDSQVTEFGCRSPSPISR